LRPDVDSGPAVRGIDSNITKGTRKRPAGVNKGLAGNLLATGPGHAEGKLAARHWGPDPLRSGGGRARGSPGGGPIRREKLIGFGNSEGKIGLVDEFCSHRGASLYFGRNEENGIRCAYHGLKFAIDGRCVDVPSAPQARKHMGIKGYPCIERAGM